MTVQVADRLSQLYVGNGVNTRFDFIFRVFDQEDETGVAVRVKVGNDFVFLDQSKYAVTVNQDNLGGYVTFNEAPSNQTFFYIAGKTPVDQQLDITNYDNFYPDAIERALDKLTAILQEWKHLVDFETQARILADIDYDQLALQREAELKAYIDGVASSIIGQPVVGLPAQFVQDGPENQKEINSITPRYFSSVDELLAYPHKRNGLIAITKSYHAGLSKGGSKYVYDSSKASINNGVSIIKGWVLQFDGRVCVTQAGCKLDGVNDDSIAFNACADLDLPMCAKHSGRLRCLSPLRLNTHGFVGSGMFTQIDAVGGHDGIILPLGGGRLFQNIEKFFLLSSDNSAQNHFAIRSQEITNPATQPLGNGFKIRDIEIGGGGRFGCGIALTDCFRTSINDIGMTSCANAIVLYGRVVQCKVGVVTSNSDEFEPSSVTTTVLNKLTSLPASIDKSKRYGLLVTGSSHTGSYQYPESIKSRDNSYVKHDYGLYHYDGLFCSYKDIDLDYNLLHGAYFYSCNGIVTLETAWIAQNTGASHGIVIETSTTENKRLVIKNVFGTAYGSLTASSSIVYQSSNGTTEPYRAGLEIDGVVCGSSLFSYAVHLNRSKNFALSRVMEEQPAINYGVLLENCQDFSFKNCDLNKSKLDSITGNYELSQVSGTIDYAFMGSAKNTSSVENSLSVFNKKFGLSATAGGYAAPIQFDGGYLWIASSGKLMKKVGSVAPTSDTDGVEIT